MQDIVLFGAGGMAREVAGIINSINDKKQTYRLVAYVVDDRFYKKGQDIRGIPIQNREWLLKHKDDVGCCCAIGYPKERRTAQTGLMAEGIRFVNIIHPEVSCGDGTTIGNGCIFYPRVGVSVDCKLGDGIFFSDHVSVGHDAIIEDFVTIFPKGQVSGGVCIGEAACVGSMVFISEHKKIGKEAVIAPGSIVFTNVREGTHVMGNPAKKVIL